MATVQAKLPEQESGLMDLLKIFSTQMGGGTTKSTSGPSAEAMGNSNQLLQQIQSGANPELLQQLAASILDKANQQVAPAIGQSIGAGNRAYSDTALQDSIARARAYATEAISKANLDYIADSNRTAAGIVNAQLASTRTQTQGSGATALGKVGALGAGALGVYGLAKKLMKAGAGEAGDAISTGIPAAVASAGMASGIDQIEWTGALDQLGGGVDAATSAAEAADTYSTFEALGNEGGSLADFGFPGMGSAFNLLTGNNEGGQSGENLALAAIPGIGPLLSLANSFDVPIVSDVVDVAGDIVSDIGDAVGCFITTAVIKSTGKPDNCFELQTLRRFRDTYMQEDPRYRAFVTQYYQEAPQLVSELEALKNKRVVYFFLYAAYILPAIYAIRGEKNEIALELYASMFYMVKHIILGHPREDISELAQGA